MIKDFSNGYFTNGYFTNDYFKLKKDLPVFLPSLETGRSFAIYNIYIIYNCFTAIMTTFFDRKPSLCTILIISHSASHELSQGVPSGVPSGCPSSRSWILREMETASMPEALLSSSGDP